MRGVPSDLGVSLRRVRAAAGARPVGLVPATDGSPDTTGLLDPDGVRRPAAVALADRMPPSAVAGPGLPDIVLSRFWLSVAAVLAVGAGLLVLAGRPASGRHRTHPVGRPRRR